MIPVRPVIRSTLPRAAARSARIARQQRVRFQSTTSAGASAGSGSSGFTAGIAGGVAGTLLCYGIYSFTPAGRTASKLNKAVKDAEQTYQAAAKKLQESAPSPDDAASYIKQLAYSYTSWVPGGRAYVDAAFRDWEKIRENHREEADALVSDAYKKFQEVARAGLTLEAASKAYEAVTELAAKVAELSGDAVADILDNHPQAKEKLGGNIDQLKKMGEQYGPEAKKQVDETWRQLKELAAGGFSAANVDKARKMIEEKVQQVRKLGDEAWKRGLEEAKPYLDKNPKIRELVEENADALKQGNAGELFEKAKKAADSGDLGGLESYVGDAVQKAKSAASSASSSLGSFAGLDQYIKMIPQGEEIVPRIQQLSEVAEKHKDEGEELLKETLEELKTVLEKKADKAEEIIQRAQKEASK